MLGSVEVRLLGSDAGRGVAGWTLRGVGSLELDGLPTERAYSEVPPAGPAHANGVRAIDHVVVLTPDLDRTVSRLQAGGLELRRIREQPSATGAPRQAFFSLGAEILEVVQGSPAEGPARFWGLALLTGDLDDSARVLGEDLGEIHAAVQPGRRIATIRRTAGLSVPVALISARERG